MTTRTYCLVAILSCEFIPQKLAKIVQRYHHHSFSLHIVFMSILATRFVLHLSIHFISLLCQWKPKLEQSFLVASEVNNYNYYLSETDKVDRNPSITFQKHVLLTLHLS